MTCCVARLRLDVQGTDHTVEIIAAILLPVAILMCAYALTVFIWRAKAITKKQVCPVFWASCNLMLSSCCCHWLLPKLSQRT